MKSDIFQVDVVSYSNLHGFCVNLDTKTNGHESIRISLYFSLIITGIYHLCDNITGKIHTHSKSSYMLCC